MLGKFILLLTVVWCPKANHYFLADELDGDRFGSPEAYEQWLQETIHPTTYWQTYCSFESGSAPGAPLNFSVQPGG